MSIPTNEEILQILDRLDEGIADDLESEFLDFKPWKDAKHELRIAVEYAVCFANAGGGVVVFGVADKTRGRAGAIHGARGYDVDTWQRGIFDATRPNLTVSVEELSVPEGTGTLLVVRVPKGPTPPYGTAQGTYKLRVGKNCMPLDPQSFARMQITSGAVDWSGQPARGVALSDLDPVEIARARNVLSRYDPEAELLQVDDTQFLTGLGVVRDGQVTHAGLLLFGRESLLTRLCPQHEVHYVHQISDTEVARNESYRWGLIHILERIDDLFASPTNPERELLIGLFMMRIPAFPPTAVREAWLNAVTHRDYSDPGEVLIRQTEREVVVVSPGGFLSGITPRNILRREPRSRNRALAEAFQKLRLVERAGIGRRRIFMPMLEYGKQPPVYETDGERVVLRFANATFDSRMPVLVAHRKREGKPLDMDALLVVSYMRSHADVEPARASELLQLPLRDAQAVLDHLAEPETELLERRGEGEAARYRLTESVARKLLGESR